MSEGDYYLKSLNSFKDSTGNYAHGIFIRGVRDYGFYCYLWRCPSSKEFHTYKRSELLDYLRHIITLGYDIPIKVFRRLEDELWLNGEYYGINKGE